MLQKLKGIFSKFPFHTILLPVFFVCAKYALYNGLLDVKETLQSGLLIAFGTLIVFLALLLFQKNIQKAAVATTGIGFLFLFFGDIRTGLQQSGSIHFLSQYKFLLPLLALILFFVLRSIAKAKNPNKPALLLNLLLLIYTGIEICKLTFSDNDSEAKTSYRLHTVPDSLKKYLPDIYYIVPDCYPSSTYQSEMLGISNQWFDDSLQQKGFRVLQQSRSNYHRTVFSMLGTFTMDYPLWLSSEKKIGPKEYNHAINDVQSAPLFSFLQQSGYDIVNLSLFNLADKPAFRKEKFLSNTTSEMIFGLTFWNYFSRDIYYRWFKKKQVNKNVSQQKLYEPLKLQALKTVDSLIKCSNVSMLPKFVYAHLSFPHFPYFYDSTGNAYLPEMIYNDSLITDRKKFAGYIKYSNRQLLKIIDSLKICSNNKAVIIIQSDHGIMDLDRSRRNDAFRNYTAVYFPDRDYKNLYDSMSNVNTFRVLLNKYFNQQLSLLKDYSVFTSY